MTKKQKIDHAVKWFMELSSDRQAKAVRELFEHAIASEWVGVWDQNDIQEMSAESGRPADEYRAPYFRTCGDSLA